MADINLTDLADGATGQFDDAEFWAGVGTPRVPFAFNIGMIVGHAIAQAQELLKAHNEAPGAHPHILAETNRLEDLISTNIQSLGLHENRLDELSDGVESNDTDIMQIMSQIKALRLERVGVELLPDPTRDQRTTQLNATGFGRTAQDVRQMPSFTDIPLFANSRSQSDVTYLSRYDHFLMTFHLCDNSWKTLSKTVVTFEFNDWLELVAVPQPGQAAYQNARVDDGRSLSWYWEDASGNDRTIYIGRTNESNSRFLFAVRGFQGQIRLEVRAYRGAI